MVSNVEEDLDVAANFWSKEIQSALDGKFGKDRVGFLLVLATSGTGGYVMMRTSLKLSGAVAFLEELASKVKNGLIGRITH